MSQKKASNLKTILKFLSIALVAILAFITISSKVRHNQVIEESKASSSIYLEATSEEAGGLKESGENPSSTNKSESTDTETTTLSKETQSTTSASQAESSKNTSTSKTKKNLSESSKNKQSNQKSNKRKPGGKVNPDSSNNSGTEDMGIGFDETEKSSSKKSTTTTKKATTTTTPKHTKKPTSSTIPETFSVNLTIDASQVNKYAWGFEDYVINSVPKGGYFAHNLQMTVHKGDTIMAATKKFLNQNGYSYEITGFSSREYLAGIAEIYEFDGGPGSGWIIELNGRHLNTGANTIALQPGDNIYWYYDADYAKYA